MEAKMPEKPGVVQKLFAVRDVKADSFGPIIVAPNRALAMRAFMEASEQPGPFQKYPDDFHMYEIGEYETRSGEVKAHKLPEFVMSARDAQPRAAAVPSQEVVS